MKLKNIYVYNPSVELTNASLFIKSYCSIIVRSSSPSQTTNKSQIKRVCKNTKITFCTRDRSSKNTEQLSLAVRTSCRLNSSRDGGGVYYI